MKVMNRKVFEKLNLFGMEHKYADENHHFTGDVYIKELPETGETGGLLLNVTFAPGCYNNWHTHCADEGGGQHLLCVAGEGWYQEDGKEAVSLTPGTVICIQEGVRHWHGAKVDSWFTHVAVAIPGVNAYTDWEDTALSRAEYMKLK